MFTQLTLWTEPTWEVNRCSGSPKFPEFNGIQRLITTFTKLVTRPHLESYWSSQNFWNVHVPFNTVRPYNLGSQVVFILQVFQQKFIHSFSPSQCVPHAPPPYFMFFDCFTHFHLNSVWWGMQYIKLPIIQSPPASRYFHSLSYKYSP